MAIKIKRSLFLTLFIILNAIQLVSCIKKEKSPADTLIIGLTSYPNTLDPRFATDANGQRLCSLIFSSLVRLGPELEVIGELAETWTYKDLTYTFNLRPNIKFQNGRALTKEDILFSFDEYKKTSSPFNFVTANIEKVEAEYSDKIKVVKIKLKSFSAVFLTDLSPLKILPKTETLLIDADFGSHPLGSGPFSFVDKDTTKINLKKNTFFFSEAPKINNLLFHIIKDANTLYLKFYKGYVDVVQSDLPRTKISFLEKSGLFNIYKSPAPNMTYILVKLKNKMLSDLDFRKALSQSLDRQDIIKFKLEGLAIEASSILAPNNPFHFKSAANSYDIGSAKKIMQKFLPVKTPIVLKTSNDKIAIENGKVLAFQMRNLGIPIELKSYEWGTFYNDLKNGNYDLATMKWVGATDPDIYRIAFHSKEHPPGRNRGFYQNLELDKLLDSGLLIENQSERVKHYSRVQEIVLRDLPMIPLWYDLQVAAVSKRVSGYTIAKNGDFSFAAWVSKK